MPHHHHQSSRPRRWGRRAAAALGIVVLVLVVRPDPAPALTHTWTGAGATENWSDAANWSSGVVPGSADVAVFDPTSTKPAVLDVNVSVDGLRVDTGYTGTITQGAGVTLTVGASGYSQADGAFVGGTAAITMNGPSTVSGGSFTSTTGRLTLAAGMTVAGTFDPNGGEVRVSGLGTIDAPAGLPLYRFTVDTTSTLTVADGTTLTIADTFGFVRGTINQATPAPAGTLALAGDVTQSSTAGAGSALLRITGTGAQTFTGSATTTAGSFPDVVVDKPTGTLTLAGTIRTARQFSVASGAVDAGASRMVIVNGSRLSGSFDLYDLTVAGGGTATVADGTTVGVAGLLDLVDGALAQAVAGPSGALRVLGDVRQSSTADSGTATITLAGTGAQTFTGNATSTAGALPNVTVDKPSGTLGLAGKIRTGRAWTHVSGAVDPGTATFVLAGATLVGALDFATVEVRAASTVAAGAAVTTTTLSMPVAGALTVSGTVVAGTATFTDGSIAGTGTVSVTGDVTIGSLYDGGAGTLRLDGTGDQLLTGNTTTSAGSLPSFVVDKPSGTLTLAGTIRTNRNWTLLAGTVDAGASHVVFAGNQVLTGTQQLNRVTLNAAVTRTVADGTTITVADALGLTDGSLSQAAVPAGGSFRAEGDVTVDSTFDGGTGTVVIGGSGDQTVTGTATTSTGLMPNLRIDKPSGTASLVGTFRTNRSWAQLAGDVDPGTSRLVSRGGSVSGTVLLYDHDVRGTTAIPAGSTVTLSGGLNVEGTLNLDGAVSVRGTVNLVNGAVNGTGAISAAGDLVQESTADAGSASVRIVGAGAQTFTGNATTSSGSLPAVVVDKPSGALALAGTIRTNRPWTVVAGTVDPGASRLVAAGGRLEGGVLLHHLDVRGAVAVPADSTVSVAGDLLLNGATFTVDGEVTVTGATSLVDGTTAGAGSVRLLGDVTQEATFDVSTGLLVLAGAGPQTLQGNATATAGGLPPVTIDKPSGTLTLSGTIRSTRAWTHVRGTVDPGGSTFHSAGAQTFTGSHAFFDLTMIPRFTRTFASGSSFEVLGRLTLTDGVIAQTAPPASGTIVLRGDLDVASTWDASTASVRVAGTAGQTMTGTSTTTAGQLPPIVIDKPSGTLQLAGTIRTAAGWTWLAGAVNAGSSRVVFAGTQTISGTQTFWDVSLQGSGTRTVADGDTVTVAGRLELLDGRLNQAVTPAAGSVVALGDVNQGNLSDTGTATVRIAGTGVQTFSGADDGNDELPIVVIDKPSGTLTLTGTIRTDRAWRHVAGTVDPGTSQVTFAGTLTVDAGGMTFATAQVRSGTVTLAAPLTVVDDLVQAGGTLATAGFDVAVGGDVVVTGGSVSAPSGALRLNGTATQTLGGSRSSSWADVVLTNPTGASLTGDVHVAGTLRLDGGDFVVGANELALGSPLGGDPAKLVTDATSSIRVTGTAPGIVLPPGVTALAALELENPAGVDLTAPLAVATSLQLDDGVVRAGDHGVRVAAGATVTRAAGWVAGVLTKPVDAGPSVAVTYEVGDASYAPVGLVLHDVAAPGELALRAVAGDASDLAASGLSPWASVNRVWKLTPAGGLTLGTADVVLGFDAAALDAGADPATFEVRSSAAGAWSRPAPGARTATSTEATGVTALGDLVVGTPVADLWVTADGPVGSVDVGAPAVYSVVVGNNGPSIATDVVVTQQLPAGATLESAETSQGTCASVGTAVVCAVGALAPGQSVTIAVSVTPSTAGSATSSVSVTSPTVDPDPGNDGASVNVDVDSVADLSVVLTASADTVRVGESLALRTTVANAGPGDADDVVLDLDLPASAVVVSDGGCAPSAGGLQCALGRLAAGAAVEVVVVVAPTTAGTSAASATVASGASDHVAANDTASRSVTVRDGATPDTLGLSVAWAPAVPTVGQLLVFTVSITNTGEEPLTGVVAAAELGAATDERPVSDVPPGMALDLVYEIVPADAGVLSARFSVTADGVATATAVHDVLVAPVPAPNVTVRLRSGGGTSVVGGSQRFAVEVQNEGSASSEPFELTVDLEGADADVAAPGCRVEGRRMTCRVEALAAGELATFPFEVRFVAGGDVQLRVRSDVAPEVVDGMTVEPVRPPVWASAPSTRARPAPAPEPAVIAAPAPAEPAPEVPAAPPPALPAPEERERGPVPVIDISRRDASAESSSRWPISARTTAAAIAAAAVAGVAVGRRRIGWPRP